MTINTEDSHDEMCKCGHKRLEHCNLNSDMDMLFGKGKCAKRKCRCRKFRIIFPNKKGDH